MSLETKSTESTHMPNIDWQEFSSKEKSDYLLKSGHLSDCSFVVGGTGEVKTLRCHKWIMINASHVFERMFYGNFKEAVRILLDDINPNHFEKFIDFIYYNDNEKLRFFPINSIIGVLRIANRFRVVPLTQSCITIIKEKLPNIQIKDFVSVFKYAYEMEDADLKDCINQNINKISEQIEPAAVCEMDLCAFHYLITILESVLSEQKRFGLIETYIKLKRFDKFVAAADEDQEIEALGRKVLSCKDYLLRLINFNRMKAFEFCNGPGKSDLLTLNEKYEILSSICENNDTCKHCGNYV